MLVLIQILKHFRRLGPQSVNDLMHQFDIAKKRGIHDLVQRLDVIYGISLTTTQIILLNHAICKDRHYAALKLIEVVLK